MTTLSEIKKKIYQLFGDTSVSPQVTREALEEIRELVEELIDTLSEDEDDN